MTILQIDYLNSLTNTQLERLYNRIYERYTRGNGYQPWGYDWPTLRVLCPHFYAVMRYINDLLTPQAA